MGWQREPILAERKTKAPRTAGTTPVAGVDAPLPRRPPFKEKRQEVMRDGILATMKANKTTARPLRACASYTWRPATRTPQPADSSWEYVTRRRERPAAAAFAADRRPASAAIPDAAKSGTGGAALHR